MFLANNHPDWGCWLYAKIEKTDEKLGSWKYLGRWNVLSRTFKYFQIIGTIVVSVAIWHLVTTTPGLPWSIGWTTAGSIPAWTVAAGTYVLVFLCETLYMKVWRNWKISLMEKHFSEGYVQGIQQL
jgi:hypothetical protein